MASLNMRMGKEQQWFLLRLALVLVLFLGLLAALVYPEFLRGKRLDEQISATKYAILEQEMFSPLYQKLQNDLERTLPGDLPLAQRAPLAKGGMNELPALVNRAASSAGYEALEVTVDPASLSQYPGRIMIRVVVSGPLNLFRDFFLSFSTLPFVDHLEKMEMRAVPGGVEVMLQALVLLEEAGEVEDAANESGGGE